MDDTELRSVIAQHLVDTSPRYDEASFGLSAERPHLAEMLLLLAEAQREITRAAKLAAMLDRLLHPQTLH